MPKPERWYSLEEIAEHIGVSQDTIHRWIRIKNMPAHKAGKLWKFDVNEVNKWVKSGKAAE
jgi:excisionase family DNA binding protein